MKALGRILRAAAFGATISVAAVGCGGKGSEKKPEPVKPAAVPPGWKLHQQPLYSIALPPEFEVTTEDSKQFPGQKMLDGRLAGNQLAQVIGVAERTDKTFKQLLLLNDSNLMVNFPKRKTISSGPIKVAGAKQARLIVLELPADKAAGFPEKQRYLEVVARSGQGVSVDVLAAAPFSAVDEAQVDQIVKTITIKPPATNG